MESLSIKKVYRAKEIAETFNIGRSTVWEYAKQGKLTPVKVSPRVTIFKASEVNALFGLNEVILDDQPKQTEKRKKRRKILRKKKKSQISDE